MKKIQDFDIWYWFLKIHVCFCFRQYYKKICVENIKNIPKNKAIIFAPNHQNALLDAMVLLAVRRGQPVFLARSDIFKKKTVAKILNFLNILPVYRIRDGVGELDKNAEIFDKAVDVLKDNVELCLMPEGQQSFKRTLLPLVKGMFRIAFSAQETIKNQEVVIVPIGIDYEDYVKPGAGLVVRFGKPLEIADYMELHLENQAKAFNVLRDDLYAGISSLIQNIRSKENYNAFYELSVIADSDICTAQQQKNTIVDILNARQKISIALDKNEAENPEKIGLLLNHFEEYKRNLKAAKLDDDSVAKAPKLCSILLKSILLIIGFPIFCYGWLANCIPAYAPHFMIAKLKDDSFKGSFKFVLWLILYTLYYLIVLVVFICVLPSFWWVIGGLASFLLLGRFAFEYRKWAKTIFTQIRYSILGKKQKEILQTQRSKVVGTIAAMLNE